MVEIRYSIEKSTSLKKKVLKLLKKTSNSKIEPNILYEFLEKKKRSFLLSQSLIAQKICAKVLKKAVVE